MAETAPLRVQLIAKTEFLAPPDVPWTTDADGGPALVEFAGRACYQSWSKPNPKTATNAGYIKHIIDVGHFSVLEHASVSFYITGISRSCAHELIRHRHFSYSQLSQRYVPERDSQVVMPPGMDDDPELRQILTAAADASRATYNELLAKLEAKFADQPSAVLRRKQARQAARAVLPNATETRIVVTGNYRAWRHFIACGPASTPTWKSGGWPSSACASSPAWRRRCSPTSRSPRWRMAPRSPPALWPQRPEAKPHLSPQSTMWLIAPPYLC